jgi:hypothetical protein
MADSPAIPSSPAQVAEQALKERDFMRAADLYGLLQKKEKKDHTQRATWLRKQCLCLNLLQRGDDVVTLLLGILEKNPTRPEWYVLYQELGNVYRKNDAPSARVVEVEMRHLAYVLAPVGEVQTDLVKPLQDARAREQQSLVKNGDGVLNSAYAAVEERAEQLAKLAAAVLGPSQVDMHLAAIKMLTSGSPTALGFKATVDMKIVRSIFAVAGLALNKSTKFGKEKWAIQ